MIALAAVMLITLVRLSVVAQLEARQDRYLEAKAALATSHQAMLDQQTGLRGWQLSGDRRFLAPYSSGSKSLEEADAALFADTAQDPRLAALVLSNSRDQQAWIDLWVPRALDAGPESRASSSLNLEGKRLFDAYRESAATLHSGIDEQLALLHQRDQQVFWFGAITQMLIAAFALLSSRRQLGRLHENVALPLQELLVTVRRVRDGDLSAVASARGPAELQDLAAQLAETTEALAGARDRGDQRRRSWPHRQSRPSARSSSPATSTPPLTSRPSASPSSPARCVCPDSPRPGSGSPTRIVRSCGCRGPRARWPSLPPSCCGSATRWPAAVPSTARRCSPPTRVLACGGRARCLGWRCR